MIILFSKITKEVKFIDQESKRDSFSELAYINLKFKEFCILCELEEVEGKYLFSIREQKCILHFEEDINELLVLLESWFTDLYTVRVATQGIGLGLYLYIEESK
jgi:hypothetical protein